MGPGWKHFPFLERFVFSHPILPWLKSASSELGMDLTTLGCLQLPCSSPALTQLPLPAPLAPRTPLTPSLKGVKGFDSSGRNTSYTSRWKMVTVCLFPSFVFACLLMRAELGGWERQQNREFSRPWNQTVPKTGPGGRIIFLIEGMGGKEGSSFPFSPLPYSPLSLNSTCSLCGSMPQTQALDPSLTHHGPPTPRTPHPIYAWCSVWLAAFVQCGGRERLGVCERGPGRSPGRVGISRQREN